LQTSHEDVDLLALGDTVATHQEFVKLILLVVNGSGTAKVGEFPQQIATQGRAEPLVDALDELGPGEGVPWFQG
jgi:hypothetical protein